MLQMELDTSYDNISEVLSLLQRYKQKIIVHNGDRVKSKPKKLACVASSIKHAAFRRKSKEWLARNQADVSEWCDMFTRGLLFQ
jgi:hypothetical protein